jgi:chromosome segregation ATPase
MRAALENAKAKEQHAQTTMEQALLKEQQVSVAIAKVNTEKQQTHEKCIRAEMAEYQAQTNIANLQKQLLEKQDIEQKMKHLSHEHDSLAAELVKTRFQVAQQTEMTKKLEHDKDAMAQIVNAMQLQELALKAQLNALQPLLEKTKKDLDEANQTVQELAAKSKCDPVTFESLTSPIAAACGHVFNAQTLIDVRNHGPSLCPCCRKPIAVVEDRYL